jgi:hypothetical protein
LGKVLEGVDGAVESPPQSLQRDPLALHLGRGWGQSLTNKKIEHLAGEDAILAVEDEEATGVDAAPNSSLHCLLGYKGEVFFHRFRTVKCIQLIF